MLNRNNNNIKGSLSYIFNAGVAQDEIDKSQNWSIKLSVLITTNFSNFRVTHLVAI